MSDTQYDLATRVIWQEFRVNLMRELQRHAIRVMRLCALGFAAYMVLRARGRTPITTGSGDG
jgi:hypothetical protein